VECFVKLRHHLIKEECDALLGTDDKGHARGVSYNKTGAGRNEEKEGNLIPFSH